MINNTITIILYVGIFNSDQFEGAMQFDDSISFDSIRRFTSIELNRRTKGAHCARVTPVTHCREEFSVHRCN